MLPSPLILSLKYHFRIGKDMLATLMITFTKSLTGLSSYLSPPLTL